MFYYSRRSPEYSLTEMFYVIKIQSLKAQHKELLGKIHVQLVSDWDNLWTVKQKLPLLLETRSEILGHLGLIFVSVLVLQPLVWPLFLLNEMPRI